MLFAAGFGTRMGHLTRNRPKPLLPVAGKPLIDHALSVAREAEVRDIFVNTHYLGNQVAEHLRGNPEIKVVHEEGEILETGGGLQNALGHMAAPASVFTLNPDVIWTGSNPLSALREAWQPDKMDALLMLVRPNQAQGHNGKGDFLVSPMGRLHRGPGAIYAGAQIIKTAPVRSHQTGSFSLNEVWDEILQRDRLFGVYHQGLWCDVGRPEGITKAEALLELEAP